MPASAEAFALAEAELADVALHVEEIRAEVDRVPAGSSARGDSLRESLADVEQRLRALVDEVQRWNREEVDDG